MKLIITKRIASMGNCLLARRRDLAFGGLTTGLLGMSHFLLVYVRIRIKSNSLVIPDHFINADTVYSLTLYLQTTKEKGAIKCLE